MVFTETIFAETSVPRLRLPAILRFHHSMTGGGFLPPGQQGRPPAEAHEQRWVSRLRRLAAPGGDLLPPYGRPWKPRRLRGKDGV